MKVDGSRECESGSESCEGSISFADCPRTYIDSEGGGLCCGYQMATKGCWTSKQRLGGVE